MTVENNSALVKDRRPLKTRSWWIFQTIAARIAHAGICPNAISVASVGFAILGAVGFIGTAELTGEIPPRVAWLLAVVGIQLRLIANLLDGMVAVEGGRAATTGPLYNEVPDRISDPILLIAAGYAYSGNPTAGWAAAICALLVAYIRAIAASIGTGQIFHGPMAKQQRMATLTAVGFMGVLLPRSWLMFNASIGKFGLVEAALWIIIIGCIVTVIRRLRIAANRLRAAGNQDS